MFTHVLHQYMRERERARGILIITQTGWCTLHGSDQSLKWFSLGLNVLWFVNLQCSMIIRIGNLEYKSTTSNIYIYIKHIIKNKSTTLYFSEEKTDQKAIIILQKKNQKRSNNKLFQLVFVINGTLSCTKHWPMHKSQNERHKLTNNLRHNFHQNLRRNHPERMRKHKDKEQYKIKKKEKKKERTNSVHPSYTKEYLNGSTCIACHQEHELEKNICSCMNRNSISGCRIAFYFVFTVKSLSSSRGSCVAKVDITHSNGPGALCAASPKGIAPSSGLDNEREHNLVHIQHCETYHHWCNALLGHSSWIVQSICPLQHLLV